MAARIYWDSCVAIYQVEQVGPWLAHIEQRLLGLPGDARLCFTDLTWMECRVGPMRADYRGAFAASDADRKRAQMARIEILSGSELKDAKGQLSRRWMAASA